MSIVINKVYEVKTARKYEILVLVTNDDDDVCVCVCVCVYSVTQSCLTLCDSTDSIAFKAPLSMEFLRQEYWSRLPLPSPGDLPGPGIKPKSLVSPALASGFLTTCAIWEVLMITVYCFPGLKISRSMSCLKSLYFVVSTMETSTEKMLDL